MESGTPSNWVSQMMKIFCNMVGFPIVKHEVQCLALFRLLEQECLKVMDGGEPKRSVNPWSRGLRELKTMVSLLGGEAEFLRLQWGLLAVVNDSTTSFLECKGA